MDFQTPLVLYERVPRTNAGLNAETFRFTRTQKFKRLFYGLGALRLRRVCV